MKDLDFIVTGSRTRLCYYLPKEGNFRYLCTTTCRFISLFLLEIFADQNTIKNLDY